MPGLKEISGYHSEGPTSFNNLWFHHSNNTRFLPASNFSPSMPLDIIPRQRLIIPGNYCFVKSSITTYMCLSSSYKVKYLHNLANLEHTNSKLATFIPIHYDLK